MLFTRQGHRAVVSGRRKRRQVFGLLDQQGLRLGVLIDVQRDALDVLAMAHHHWLETETAETAHVRRGHRVGIGDRRGLQRVHRTRIAELAAQPGCGLGRCPAKATGQNGDEEPACP